MTKITFTGDIIIAPEQLQAITKNADGNFSTIFEPIASLLKESDFVVGNLETPLGGKNLGYTNHKWSFNTPDELADALREIGFNMLTTANNHCLDRDKEGLVRTIHCLDRYGLDHIGTYATKEERDMVYIKRFGNLKIAFLSYTYGTNAAFNKHYLEKKVTAKYNNETKSYVMGITAAMKQLTFAEAIRQGINQFIEYALLIFTTLGKLITDMTHTVSQLSGPVGIYTVTAQVTQTGSISTLLSLTALLSTNIGMFNLLPIPGLDGSQVLFALIEKVIRREIPTRIKYALQMAGLILAFGLMIFATVNDIGKFF